MFQNVQKVGIDNGKLLLLLSQQRGTPPTFRPTRKMPQTGVGSQSVQQDQDTFYIHARVVGQIETLQGATMWTGQEGGYNLTRHGGQEIVGEIQISNTTAAAVVVAGEGLYQHLNTRIANQVAVKIQRLQPPRR